MQTFKLVDSCKNSRQFIYKTILDKEINFISQHFFPVINYVLMKNIKTSSDLDILV